MRVPDVPTPRAVPAISPSLYEALLACPAKAVWYAHGSRDALAPHPAALLGTCFHAVMEALQKGRLLGDAAERQNSARSLFDEVARQVHTDAHPLLRVKFPSPQNLPYYNLLRERAAAVAAQAPVGVDEQAEPRPQPSPLSEERFRSSDGVIVGRPDLIDVARGEVVDFKTSQAINDPGAVSPREARQLRLYAYLAGEAGLTIERGTIVRGDGHTASIAVTASEARHEATEARQALADLNNRVGNGQAFAELARPSPEGCRFCPCVPFCDAFWETADPTWQDTTGIHVEGTVTAPVNAAVHATALVTVQVRRTRGTVGGIDVSIEQVPAAWITADGDRPVEVGDVIRVVDARLVSEDPVVLRADRVMTSLWRCRTT
ncbi:MAG: PD-(D/E)XK nuclease family protein [Actinomycetota bacterium]